MRYLFILGRQPALGLAELEACFGADAVQPASDSAAMVELPDPATIPASLGSVVKAGRVLDELPSRNWQAIARHLLANAKSYADEIPEGKLTIGLSVYGFGMPARQVGGAALSLKKLLKQSGRPVRVVPNQSAELSSAQVLHNRLYSAANAEFIVLRSRHGTIIARTEYVQDIDAYSLRDRGRPKRDPKVGMLPPKLAQIIINLAVGMRQSPDEKTVVLDPFCGTGVVLQETILMGYAPYGSDLEARMVEYSRDNLKWLTETIRLPGNTAHSCRLEQADATVHTWEAPIACVASETFLGKPLTSLPPRAVLDAVTSECDRLHRRFLRNMAQQLAPGTRLCLAVPAWRNGKDFRRLPVVDELQSLGYNRIDFKHVRPEEMVYYREDQTVARQLLVITRK